MRAWRSSTRPRVLAPSATDCGARVQRLLLQLRQLAKCRPLCLATQRKLRSPPWPSSTSALPSRRSQDRRLQPHCRLLLPAAPPGAALLLLLAAVQLQAAVQLRALQAAVQLQVAVQLQEAVQLHHWKTRYASTPPSCIVLYRMNQRRREWALLERLCIMFYMD